MNVRLNNISIKCMLAITLSALFASCNDDVEEENNPVGSRENGAISFSTYTAGATRALDETSETIKSNGFNVAAWYDGGLYFNTNQTAGYTEVINGKNIFDPAGETYYWPGFSAGGVGFRAFNIVDGASWRKEYFSIDFNVTTNAATQHDLVIAYDSASSKPTDGIQPLNFIHALSKINFTFEGVDEDKTYTINRVEIIAAGKPKTGTSTFVSFKKNELTGLTSDGKISGTQNDKVVWDFTEITDGQLVEGLPDKSGSKESQGVLYTYYDDQTGVSNNPRATTNKGKISLPDQNFMLIPQSGRIAIRVYYKIEDSYGDVKNCGYYATDKNGNHNVSNSAGFVGVRGCKTQIIDLGKNGTPIWEAGKAYRYTLSLPTDNYIGDKDNDGVADGKDEEGNNLDGDNDTNDSEFDNSESEYIEFSVSVSKWDQIVENDGNILIK